MLSYDAIFYLNSIVWLEGILKEKVVCPFWFVIAKSPKEMISIPKIASYSSLSQAIAIILVTISPVGKPAWMRKVFVNVPIFFYLDNADTPPRIIIEGFTSLFNSLHTTLAVPERLTRILSWSELHSMTFLWLIFVTSMFISFSCNYDGIFIRRWLFASMIFMTCTNLHCKESANREQNLPSLLEQLCRDAAFLIQKYTFYFI